MVIFNFFRRFDVFQRKHAACSNKLQLIRNRIVIQIVKLDETERFEQTYPLNANGRVSVSNVNGSITIETWDRTEVKLEAVKIADSSERLSEFSSENRFEAGFFQRRNRLRKTKRTGNIGKNYKTGSSISFDCSAQRCFRRNRNRQRSDQYLEYGQYHESFRRQRKSHRAINLRGTANLSTVNGTVEADFDQLQTNGKISLDTVNGTVNLTIPSDANATVKADTVNGSITNDFGLPVRKGNMSGTIYTAKSAAATCRSNSTASTAVYPLNAKMTVKI